MTTMIKVFKVIVDKKPTSCLFCPLQSSVVRIDKPQCGKVKTVDIGNGSLSCGKVPDHRCILQEKGDDDGTGQN